ncbi:hypothetical protein Trydic_g15338 [Trypoxylus dichotomus]
MVVLTLPEKIEMVLMENLSGILVMLSTFMLSVFRTGRDHGFCFSKVSNSLPADGSLQREETNRRKTITREDNAITVLLAVAYNSYVNTQEIACDSNCPKAVFGEF